VTHDLDPLRTPGEVAALFGVTPQTVARWARDGKLTVIRTPGGHHRYRESEVRALREKGAVTDAP
jgi:excisionase family DNA binding protein